MAKGKLISQDEVVLRHLRDHDHITPAIAANTYNIWRLAARIHNLRKRGYPISCSMREDARGHKYGRYTLATVN
jgi:hypothetical protein